MNRREFLGGVAATGLAPMVPTLASGAASATTGVTAAVAGNFTPYMHSWAIHHARAAGQISPKVLTDLLGVQPDVANALARRLIDKGIVGAPNAFGISRALNPMQWASETAPVKTWHATDPIHAEYVENSRLKAAVEKLTAEEKLDASVDEEHDRLVDADAEENTAQVGEEVQLEDGVKTDDEPDGSRY